MKRTKIKNAVELKRLTLKEAEKAFLQHCKVKNLSESTLGYYTEDIDYFIEHIKKRYVHEVTIDVFEDFLAEELEGGKKITSLNSRIRGLRVFFKFCAEREYMQPLTIKLMKEDESIKEPYTDAELAKLLRRPNNNSWTEWRTWAVISYRRTFPALCAVLSNGRAGNVGGGSFSCFSETKKLLCGVSSALGGEEHMWR